jgi:bifunctional oligoribonuclease and PAP phosphatase NrnA
VTDSVSPILQQAHTVYIAVHISPDGDAIGSALGLALALGSLGKHCTVACADPAPASLTFLPGAKMIVAQQPGAQDVIVVLDTGDFGRLGAIYAPAAFSGRPVINIDHHLTNTRFGTINVIDQHAAAVGEMIYMLVQALGVSFNRLIATCLLTAIVTDTIGFRTGSTTARVLRAAADLIEAGASLTDIVQQSFESRPLPVLRVWGEVLSHFQVRDGVAWASIPKRVLLQYNVKEDEIKGLVNVLRGTQGVSVSALLIENGDGNVKVEFRSTGRVNVADVANALGGGGHRAASGCVLAGPLESAEERALAEIREHSRR